MNTPETYNERGSDPNTDQSTKPRTEEIEIVENKNVGGGIILTIEFRRSGLLCARLILCCVLSLVGEGVVMIVV